MNEKSEILNEYVASFCGDLKERYAINYGSGQYNLKRGLRNADGTGVLVGFTKVGSVQGYMVEDGAPVPIPGKLYYRGYDVMDIVNAHAQDGTFGYEEVAYLLLMGKLPTHEQFRRFDTVLSHARILPDGFTEDMIIKAPSKNIMNKLARSVLALYSYDDNPDDTSIENLMRQSIELIGRFPIIVANAYAVKRHYFDGKSLYIHVPKEELSVSENFLRIVRKDSAIAGAVGSLKGPLHGGASKKVMDMFNDLKANVKDVNDDDEVAHYLGKILDGEVFDGAGKIYGLGHAVYTMSDPRAEALKKYAQKMAENTGKIDDFLLMETIERLGIPMIMDRKGITMPMCANVDMYSGLVYTMLGIPEDLLTPLFAIARIAGWCSHRIEEVLTGGRIIRPAYRSVAKKQVYVPMEKRK